MQTQVRHTVFELNQLIVPPGNKVRLQNVSWEMYESILEELGEGYAVRLAYYKGTLEIRMPLPKHEKAKSLIGYLVNVLLEELNIDCEVLGSTTFKRQDMQTGVEPDDCFYIQNQAAVLWYKACSVAIPDYYVDYLADNPWIHQPFEMYEKMSAADFISVV